MNHPSHAARALAPRWPWRIAVWCAFLFGFALPLHGARAQSVYFDQLPPDPAPGTSAEVRVVMVGSWGYRASCDGSAYGVCDFIYFDDSIDPGSFTLQVNGADQTGQFGVSTGPEQSVSADPYNPSSLYREYSQESSAVGTIVFPAGVRNAIDAAVRRTQNGAWLRDHAEFTSVAVTRADPVLSTAPHNETLRDVGRCVADCFEATAVIATPAYVSLDVPRSVGLMYRSGQAVPRGTVTLDVVDRSAEPAAALSLRLWRNGALVPFINGATELFFTRAGDTTRVMGQFDASDLSTGVYTYTAEVWSQWPGESRRSAVQVQVLIVNERVNPFAAGWSMPGLGRVVRQADGGVVLVTGDGSAAYFGPPPCGGCAYQSPPGDFSRLVERIEYSGWRGGNIWVFRRTMPDGSSDMFLRDNQGIQESASDRLGNTTWYGYEVGPVGWRVFVVTDPAGYQTAVRYQGGGSTLSAIVDPMGRGIGFGLVGGRITIADLPGQRRQFRYLPSGALETAVQPNGGEWTYAYDVAGKLQSVQAPVIRTGSTQSRPTTALISGERRILDELTAGRGSSTAVPLTGRGPSDWRTFPAIADAASLWTSYRVNAFGQPVQINAPGGLQTSIAYTGDGQPTRTVGPHGDSTRFVWNAQRPYLLDSTYDAINRVGTAYRYDAAAHDALRQVLVNGREQRYVWTRTDSRVDSVRVGGPDEAPTRFRYQRTGDPRPNVVIDPRGHTTVYGYEAVGLRNLVVTASAGTQDSVQRDAAGRVWRSIDPLGRVTVTTYDPLNRVLTVTDPAGKTTTTAYDDAAGTTTVTDAAGQQYAAGGNALGLPETSTDPGGQVTRTAYDGAGRPWLLTNRRGQTVTLGYDAQTGALASRTTSDGYTARYGADPLGRWAADSNAEARDSVYADAAGRDSVRARSFTAWPGLRFTVTSLYDSLGRRTRRILAREGASASGRAFPAMHTRYSYKPDGPLETVRVRVGDTDIATPGDGDVTFGYNDERGPSSLAMGNGVTVSNGLTALHTLGSQRYSHRYNQSLNSTLDRTFGYVLGQDAAGRVDKRFSPDMMAVREFTYDPAGRLAGDTLKGASQSGCTGIGAPGQAPGDAAPSYRCTAPFTPTGAPIAYAWDAVGNPTWAAVDVTRGNLLRWTGSIYHDYDPDGNLTIRQDQNAAWRATQRLSWNALGQLTGVWNNPQVAGPAGALTDSVTFGYDAGGQRARKTNVSRGTTTYVLTDGDELLAELDGAGDLVAHYAHHPGGVDAPLLATAFDAAGTGQTYYYVREAPGHVVGLLDEGGNIVAQYTDRFGYPAFGKGQVGPALRGGWRNPLQYGGREYDAETGLYYQRARYYDPALGRFVSQDPIGLAGGVNLYAYAGGDPVNHTDPSGLDTYCAWAEGQTRDLGMMEVGGVPYSVSGATRRWSCTEMPNFNFDPADEGSGFVPGAPGGGGGGGSGGAATSARRVAPNDPGVEALIGAGRLLTPIKPWLEAYGALATAPLFGEEEAGILLARQLGSEDLLSQAVRGFGVKMHQGAQIRDLPRLLALYGGEAADWLKMTTGAREVGGMKMSIHWYRNAALDLNVEFKTKLVSRGWWWP